MRNPGRIIVALCGIAALVLVALLIVKMVQPSPLRAMTEIQFSQYAAEPNFDNSTITVKDQAKIHELSSLVDKYNVNLDATAAESGVGCTGGTKTTVTLFFAGGGKQKFSLYDCGGTASGDNFTAKATTLFNGWRESVA